MALYTVSLLNEFSQVANKIFNQAIDDYHITDDVNVQCKNPYSAPNLEYFLYLKCWIDTVQWHLEDIIRDPNISPEEALRIKRWIDKSNQERTDLVEMIDSYFLDYFGGVRQLSGATINTESPAWAIDRLSILQLKIYHMAVESRRTDTTPEQLKSVTQKLLILQEQNKDLSEAINTLLSQMQKGEKYMKVYKQMKMYNDPLLNPVLYGQKE